jgi:hypothetical protein
MQLAAEWLPTYTVVYQPPANRVGDLCSYNSTSMCGPRESMEEAALLKKAQERVPPPPPQPRCLETTYRTTFTEKDMSRIKYAALSDTRVLYRC